MEKEINLSDNLIVGKGRDRVCYEHPNNANLCIKISITNDKQSKREVSYFKFLKKLMLTCQKYLYLEERKIPI